MALLTPVYSPPVPAWSNLSAIRGLLNGYSLSTGMHETNVEKCMDIHVSMSIMTSSAVNGSNIGLWLAGSPDGVTWPGSMSSGHVTGPSAYGLALTPQDGFMEIARIYTTTTARWFGTVVKYVGSLPPFWTLLVENLSGATLDSTYAHSVQVQSLSYEYT